MSDPRLWVQHDGYAFLTCEKCGLRTFKRLAGDLGCEAFVLPAGEEPPGTTVFVCRNPYARAVSAWYDITHASSPFNISLIHGVGADSFPAFVRWLVNVRHETRSIFNTQTGWIAGARIDRVIRLEDLDTELPKLLGHIEVPHENAADHDPWACYYDEETAATVGGWAAGDFDRFGYPRMVPCVSS